MEVMQSPHEDKKHEKPTQKIQTHHHLDPHSSEGHTDLPWWFSRDVFCVCVRESGEEIKNNKTTPSSLPPLFSIAQVTRHTFLGLPRFHTYFTLAMYE